MSRFSAQVNCRVEVYFCRVQVNCKRLKPSSLMHFARDLEFTFIFSLYHFVFKNKNFKEYSALMSRITGVYLFENNTTSPWSLLVSFIKRTFFISSYSSKISWNHEHAKVFCPNTPYELQPYLFIKQVF